MVFKMVAWAILELLIFPGFLSYKELAIRVIKLLFVSRLLICLLLRGALSQIYRKIDGKLYFLPYIWWSSILISEEVIWKSICLDVWKVILNLEQCFSSTVRSSDHLHKDLPCPQNPNTRVLSQDKGIRIFGDESQERTF